MVIYEFKIYDYNVINVKWHVNWVKLLQVIALFENDKSTNMQREYYKNNKNK